MMQNIDEDDKLRKLMKKRESNNKFARKSRQVKKEYLAKMKSDVAHFIEQNEKLRAILRDQQEISLIAPFSSGLEVQSESEPMSLIGNDSFWSGSSSGSSPVPLSTCTCSVCGDNVVVVSPDCFDADREDEICNSSGPFSLSSDSTDTMEDI